VTPYVALPPGRLRDLAGIRVVDYTALLPAGVGDPHGGSESLEFLIAHELRNEVVEELTPDLVDNSRAE
jgi:hypothetical protein